LQKPCNDASGRAGDQSASNIAVEISGEFRFAAKDFASFSKFFFGGFVEFQGVAGEKIWKCDFWVVVAFFLGIGCVGFKAPRDKDSTASDNQKEIVAIF
jgi:hypothetical protein